MLDDDKGHAGAVRQLAQQLANGLQATGRGTDAYNAGGRFVYNDLICHDVSSNFDNGELFYMFFQHTHQQPGLGGA